VEGRQDVAPGVDDHPRTEIIGALAALALGLDEHQPGPDSLVRRSGSRRLRLQLGYRGRDLLVDDGIYVVRGQRRLPGNALVRDVEGDSG
jgi:hypothetical protein